MRDDADEKDSVDEDRTGIVLDERERAPKPEPLSTEEWRRAVLGTVRVR